MSFASDVEKWSKAVNATIDQTIRAAALEVGTEIIRGTPVDTGRARNNWITTAGSPDSGTTRSASKNGAAAINNLKLTVGDFDGDVLWMSNNLKYVTYLEYGGIRGEGPSSSGGFSKQAPGGWVRKAASNYKRRLARNAAKNFSGSMLSGLRSLR